MNQNIRTLPTIVIISVTAVIGLVFIFTLYTKQGNANEATGKELNELTYGTIQLYSNDEHEKLNKLAKTEGSKTKKARIIFNDYIPATRAKELISSYKLTNVREIHIGWGSHKAGYTLKQNESLDDGIISATKAHEKFLNIAIAGSHPRLLSEFQKEKEQFDKTGMTIFGFDADGEIKQLKKIKDENQNIWLIDVDETNKGHFIIPISPNDLKSLK